MPQGTTKPSGQHHRQAAGAPPRAWWAQKGAPPRGPRVVKRGLEKRWKTGPWCGELSPRMPQLRIVLAAPVPLPCPKPPIASSKRGPAPWPFPIGWARAHTLHPMALASGARPFSGGPGPDPLTTLRNTNCVRSRRWDPDRQRDGRPACAAPGWRQGANPPAAPPAGGFRPLGAAGPSGGPLVLKLRRSGPHGPGPRDRPSRNSLWQSAGCCGVPAAPATADCARCARVARNPAGRGR